jgi:hypothetical protein
MLKIRREENDIWSAIDRALNFPQHGRVWAFYPRFARRACEVSWNSQPRRFVEVESLFKVIEPVLLPLSFRSWNIMGERA